MATIVAGVDFGTLNVRVSIFDSELGRLGSGTADYPLHRKRTDPDHCTQSHVDHMASLALATRRALQAAKISGSAVAAIALDTTGSSVVPVGAAMTPLDDYYLWCDHRRGARQPRSPPKLTNTASKPLTGPVVCIPPSGDFQASALAAAQSR